MRIYPFAYQKTAHSAKMYLGKIPVKMVHGVLTTALLHTFCANFLGFFLWRSHGRMQADSVNHTALNLILIHCMISLDNLNLYISYNMLVMNFISLG